MDAIEPDSPQLTLMKQALKFIRNFHVCLLCETLTGHTGSSLEPPECIEQDLLFTRDGVRVTLKLAACAADTLTWIQVKYGRTEIPPGLSPSEYANALVFLISIADMVTNLERQDLGLPIEEIHT